MHAAATGSVQRHRVRIQRIILVTFLTAAVLLPGLVCAVATGFSSYFGDCTWNAHPDPVTCQAG
jgi:hypothetical protein